MSQYESRASQDYKLNFRLKKECKNDIDALCKDACHPGKTSEVSDPKVRPSHPARQHTQFACASDK